MDQGRVLVWNVIRLHSLTRGDFSSRLPPRVGVGGTDDISHKEKQKHLAVCLQRKVSGKSGWQVNGTQPVGSFFWKSSKKMNVGKGNPVLPAGMFQPEVGHFWAAPSLYFRSEAMCEAIFTNMIFYSRANRTHVKGFALSFVLKVRIFGTPNWPITSMAECFG